MTEIRWAEIEAECGDFRAGFVATFRKYEGQPTDEKDAQGRTVKVTASSFARHTGIPERTFTRWVKQNGQPGRVAADGRDERGAKTVLRDPERREQVLTELPAEDKAGMVEALLDDPEVIEQMSKDVLEGIEEGVSMDDVQGGMKRAVERSLDSQFAKLVVQSSRVRQLMDEGVEFKRAGVQETADRQRDIAEMAEVLDRLEIGIRQQSKIRAA